MTDNAVDAGRGGVKLSAEPLFTGDTAPFADWRGGEDCVGEIAPVWLVCVPSGESGVLHRSFPWPVKLIQLI